MVQRSCGTPNKKKVAKDKYYIEIAANPEGDHTTNLKAWAAALDKSVPGMAVTPPSLQWFPSAGQQSLRLVPESVLGLRLLRRGYLAQYDFGKAFVVFEDNPQSAGDVMQKQRSRFGEATPVDLADEAFQAIDKYLGRLCIFRKGRHIGGYAITAPTPDPLTLAKTLAAQLK